MTFKKGQSGNPGGRPRKDDPVKMLAKKKAPEAIKKLYDIMISESSSNKDKIQCANIIIERAYGKAQQNIDADVKHSGEVVPVLRLVSPDESTTDERAAGSGSIH